MKTSNRQLRGGSSGMHPERRMKVESVRFDAGKTHPLSIKIYGSPKPSKELLASIEKVGLLQPLVINETNSGYVLLVGNTRREAWRTLYEQRKVKTIWIPCRFVRVSELEAEQLVIESNRQREKTEGQKAREVSELLRIESDLAKQRQGERTDIKAISPESSKGQATDKVAERVGWGRKKVEQATAVVRAAESGNLTAKEELKKLDKGETTVHAAYKASVAQREEKKKAKSEQQQKAADLQKLFGKRAEVQSSKEGKFNLLFYKINEDEVRRIAKVV